MQPQTAPRIWAQSVRQSNATKYHRWELPQAHYHADMMKLTLYVSISPATSSADFEVICGVSIAAGVVILPTRINQNSNNDEEKVFALALTQVRFHLPAKHHSVSLPVQTTLVSLFAAVAIERTQHASACVIFPARTCPHTQLPSEMATDQAAPPAVQQLIENTEQYTDQAAPPAMQQLVENTEQYVRTELQNRDASHDFDHINRVRKLALQLGKLEGLDANTLAVVEVAALLHDIRDWKYAARKPLLLPMGSSNTSLASMPIPLTPARFAVHTWMA